MTAERARFNEIVVGAPDGIVPDSLPSGLVTFLFTDIEGSTVRWEADPEGMIRCIGLHNDLSVRASRAHDGLVFQHTGDGISVVFASPDDAADAAIAMQLAFQQADWGDAERLKIRIGIHMGVVAPVGWDYFGPPVNMCARVMDVANGDQIAVSAAVAGYLRRHELREMGPHRLKGIGTEHVSLLVDDRLVHDDRPLRSRIERAVRGLPPASHELIGRDADLTGLADLVDGHRVVTLVGPGGVGKTHLAGSAATRVVEGFADGAAFVDLVPVGEGDDVPAAVAEVLGARTQPGLTLTDSIVHFCQQRELLLVLDNCEHVVAAVRSLVTALLTTPGVRVMMTSREPLGLPGEQLFGVQPLDPRTHGVELFLERANERDHAFTATGDDLETIGAIVDRLDGVPLAIELAAARIRALSPEQLLERLDDRFQILRGGRAGGRHQTLRDTILWSYEQLSETQAVMFERLSVFAGDFSLDAVESVCTGEGIDEFEALDLVLDLVDKSMVTTARVGGTMRYGLLGTLRQFAQERLDDRGTAAAVRGRHATFFADLVATESARLVSPAEADVWDVLTREWSNVRAAFESLLHLGDTNRAAKLVADLGWFATLAMRFEALSWATELQDRLDLDGHRLEGSVMGLTAMLAYFTVDPSVVERAERGLEIDPTDPYGYCRLALSAVSLNNELEPEASDRFTSAWVDHLHDGSPALDRLWGHGMRVFHLCANEGGVGSDEEFAAVEALATESGSASARAVAAWAGGMRKTFAGLDRALAEWRRGMDVAQSLSPSHLAYQVTVGLVLHFSAGRGDLDEVVDGCLDALRSARAQHYLAGTSHLFGVTAIVLCRLGHPEAGAALLGVMEANGHVPRDNAARAVERALGDRAGEAKRAAEGMSVDDAATMAIGLLSGEHATDELDLRERGAAPRG